MAPMAACLLAWLLACDAPPAPPAPPAPAAPSAVPAPPTGGIIGGEPILHHPVVIGAIGVAEVEAGIAAHAAELHRCFEDARAQDPALSGRVLVSFTVARDGHVARATVRSSSLRHPATEACLTERLATVRFPPLQDGETAIVSYPFAFP